MASAKVKAISARAERVGLDGGSGESSFKSLSLSDGAGLRRRASSICCRSMVGDMPGVEAFGIDGQMCAFVVRQAGVKALAQRFALAEDGRRQHPAGARSGQSELRVAL